MRWVFVSLIVLFFNVAKGQETKDSLATICDRIVFYQLPNGGWPKHYLDGKNVDYDRKIDDVLLKRIAKDNMSATIDNHATTREIAFLADCLQQQSSEKYQNAIKRGVEYLLQAQMDNGGFAQYYPDHKGYRGYVTFNDNAMINALTLLRDVGKDSKYSFLDDKIKQQASLAVKKGVDLILKLQVHDNDMLTIWAAQYHNETLLPAQARKFEPASLSASESVGIVRFLLEEEPSPAIIQSINAAINWFDRNKIIGYRFDYDKNKQGKAIRKLIKDPDGILWSRFYEIGTNRPVFGDRDDTIHYDFEEISDERKNGYAWFGSWPLNILNNNYPKWLKSLNK